MEVLNREELEAAVASNFQEYGYQPTVEHIARAQSSLREFEAQAIEGTFGELCHSCRVGGLVTKTKDKLVPWIHAHQFPAIECTAWVLREYVIRVHKGEK